MILLNIFIPNLALLFMLTAGIVSELAAFVLPKLSVNSSNTEFHYIHHILQSVSGPVLVNNPLLFDADLDGHLDAFSADLTGRIYGVLNFNCMLTNCEARQWVISVPHHSFPNSPIMIPMNRQGNSFIAFISHQAGIFAFDSSGKLSTQIQIPNLRVVLSSRESSIRQSTPDSITSIIEVAEWSFSDRHTSSSAETRVYHLQPHVFADAIHHTVPLAASLDESALLDQSTLAIPVTFISHRQLSNATVIHVTAIVTVSRRVLLLGNPTLTSHSQSAAVGLQIQVLEATEQVATGHYQPTLLLSAPVVVVTGSAQDLQGDPSAGSSRHNSHLSQFIVATTTTGHLHRVSFPLTRNNPGYFWKLGNVPLPHSCLLLQCPKNTTASSHVSSVLCCLLLDASSHLLLVELTQHQPPISHLTTVSAGPARIHWQYNATLSHHPYSVSEDDEPRGQVTLVPTCPSPGRDNSSSCSLWAVFPSPDGLVHAVDVTNGSPIPGYPIRLFQPESSSHHSATRVTFAAGSGQLSVDSSGDPWIIYSDSRGRLYHVCLLKASVVSGIICPSSLYGNTTCYEEIPSDQENSVWMSPLIVPTEKQVDITAGTVPKLASSSPVRLLIWNDRGLQLLLMSSGTYRDSKSPHDSGPLLPIPRLDISLDSTSSSGYTMAYNLYNCLSATAVPSDYHTSNRAVGHPSCAVRLLDAMGLPFSGWSTSTADHCQSNSGFRKSTNNMHCCGQFMMHHIPINGEMLIVNSAILMVLQGDPSLMWTASSDALSTAPPIRLIDTAMVQHQATLLFLTYLPGVVLLFGLLTLRIFSAADFGRQGGSRKPLLNSA